jgi:hypothetical protein
MDGIMTTSKSNPNTLTKIELNAIPPYTPSSALFYFPSQKKVYTPTELKVNSPLSSLIEIDSLIKEEYGTRSKCSTSEDFKVRKSRTIF